MGAIAAKDATQPSLQRLGWLRCGCNGWVWGTLAICAIILVPLAVVVFGLGMAGPEWREIAATVLGEYIVNTIVLVVLVCVVSLFMAIPAAWLVSIYEFPGRRILEWAMVLPLAIPTYVAAFVYIEIPEFSIPLLVHIRQSWGVAAYQLAEQGMRYGLLTILMASVLFPYLYLTARASFGRQQRSLIEAALLLGRGPFHVFRTVALPLSRPAIVGGLSLIVMEVMNDYGAVNFFGVSTLTEGVFRTWFGLGDAASGNRLASFMMFAILAMLVLERCLRGRAAYAGKDSAAGTVPRRRLRGWRLLAAYLACLIPLITGLFYPVIQLVYWCVEASRRQLPIFEYMQTANSLLVSFSVAVLLGIIALFMAYTLRLHPSRALGAIVNAASLGYATPGVAVAVGVLIAFGAIDHWHGLPFLLNGTLFAIGFGYVVRFAAVPLQAVRAGMVRIPSSLDESSRTLGRSKWATLRHVNFPLMRSMTVASVMLVFIDILKELPMTMLLRPASFNTLAVSAFGFAKEGRMHESAFPSLIIVILGAVGLFVLNRFMEDRSK